MGGETGEDHARRAVLISKEGGRAMVRWMSKVVRQRICRRPLERHAECVALGEGTAVDVAGPCQWGSGCICIWRVHLYSAEVSRSSMTVCWGSWLVEESSKRETVFTCGKHRVDG